MTAAPDDPRRPDLREALERDLRRHARREPGHSAFWRALSLLGTVGWPIVFTTAGAALLGHYLDVEWGTGVRLTLVLVTIGAAVGGAIAWHAVTGGGR